jgi:hypothetical protein
MKKIKWITPATFLGWTVPFYLNGVPREGSFTYVFVAFNLVIFAVMTSWLFFTWLGSIMRGNVKKDVILYNEIEIFYGTYKQKSHFSTEHNGGKYAPEAIKKLMEQKWNRTEASLAVSKVIVQQKSFRDVDELLYYVKKQAMIDALNS